MTPAAKSIHYFSFYLILMSLTLMLAPNILLTTVGMPETAEVWIRVVGLLAGVLGVYYFITAKYNYVQLIKATVFTRIGAAVSYTHLDVYKRQVLEFVRESPDGLAQAYLSVVTVGELRRGVERLRYRGDLPQACLLYTSRCV